MKTSVGFLAIALSAVLFACSSAAGAEDLGAVGPVYPIAERDMLESIEERLTELRSAGELARLEQDAEARYRAYASNPRGIALPRATEHRVRYHDPSITVPYALRDHTGAAIHPAGTTVNPLDHMRLSRQLLFFDGTDPAQASWAHRTLAAASTPPKPILTRGPVLDIMRDWGTWLYVDQRGFLVDRLGIRALPAVVSQEGRRLRIEEIALEVDEP